MKKRYIFFAVILLLSSPFILINILIKNYIGLIPTAAFVYMFYLTNKVEKTTTANVELTSSEKLQVIITEFFNPVIAGAFYYYCWKNRFPKKASQANLYSWIIVGIETVIAFALYYTGLIKLF